MKLCGSLPGGTMLKTSTRFPPITSAQSATMLEVATTWRGELGGAVASMAGVASEGVASADPEALVGEAVGCGISVACMGVAVRAGDQKSYGE